MVDAPADSCKASDPSTLPEAAGVNAIVIRLCAPGFRMAVVVLAMLKPAPRAVELARFHVVVLRLVTITVMVLVPPTLTVGKTALVSGVNGDATVVFGVR